MTPDDPATEPQSWHYGVMARWWAEFNTEGPEIPYFRTLVEEGQPALDVACGTGRLLIPYLQAGLDVDGCDISADMLALCRERAEAQGLSPNLYEQAMHDLDLPRRYRTIYICGGFGIGGRRDHDEQALRRIFEHLEPGGALVLDNEVPYRDGWSWRYWTEEGRREIPGPWDEPGDRRTGQDGTEYELRTRIVELDPLAQRITMEVRGSMWRAGLLVAEDGYTLKMTLYFTNELRLMLERVGFSDVEVQGDYAGQSPTADTRFVVFIARRPGVRIPS